MKIVAIIPARMGSSRFPGKPMAALNGMPMIERVYRNIKKCEFLADVIVATCDKVIFDHINTIGGKAIMTSNNHERATDRCAEALLHYERDANVRVDIMVMVQGDEPMTNAQMIKEAVSPMMQSQEIQVINLLGKIKNNFEFEDRNTIKVVCDLNFNALYFSREPIPTRFKTENIPVGKQVCVMPFKREYLFHYAQLAPSPLEIVESIDMLRILEHGEKVKMIQTQFDSYSVDTKEDLIRVSKIMLDSSE